MKTKIRLTIVILLAYLLAGCGIQGARSSCQDFQGSYKIENSVDLYIKHQRMGDYPAVAMIVPEGGSPEFYPVLTLDEKDLDRDRVPKCSIGIKGIGILAPSVKDKTYDVSTELANNLSERKPGTPWVLMEGNGFMFNVHGVVKTSSTLPDNILAKFKKGMAHE